MALSSITWATMLFALVALPGVASIVLLRSLRTEERKLELIKTQDAIDSYSPEALFDLREWIQEHPDDPYESDARQRYNECVRTLRTVDETYYNWSVQQIEDLELIEE